MSRRPFVLVLTGSIGTGKSTTAQMFRDLGYPVWDADEVVAKLYSEGGLAVPEIAALVPDALQDGAISTAKLRTAISRDETLLKRIEKVVHPLVAQDREEFLEDQSQARLVVLDIPLFFETSSRIDVDGVLVVTTSPAEQKRRVLERGTMNEDDLKLILSRQMPDEEKRARADYVIETVSMAQTRQDVQNLINTIEAN